MATPEYSKSKKPKVKTAFSSGLIALLAFAIFFSRNFSTIQVSGVSMEPTFSSGDKLLATRAYWLVGNLRDNDIVVVSDEDTGEHIIKRVYKMAGEKVDWLNIPTDYSMASGEYVVPEGQIYLLGDNRDESEDSRRFGPVPLSRVLGKIVLKKWL